jgi:SHS2 domain-containing protein
MKKYKLLEHQADLKIKIFSQTKEGLFANALFAMTENINPTIEESAPITEEKIEVEADDLPFLLIDFLNEVLYLTQVNKKAYYDLKSVEITTTAPSQKTKIKATLIGRPIISFGRDIKAATYHSLEVSHKQDNRWEAIVLFDV